MHVYYAQENKKNITTHGIHSTQRDNSYDFLWQEAKKKYNFKREKQYSLTYAFHLKHSSD